MGSTLWTKNFIANTVTNLLLYMVYYMLMVITASHAMNVLHATASEAGLASGLFVLGGVTARLVCGRLTGKAGCKKVLTIGLGFYLGTSLLYLLASSITLFSLVRFLHGLGFGASATATGSIAAKLVPKERQGEGISYFSLSWPIASAIGPMISVTMTQNNPFNSVILLVAVLTALSIGVSLFITLPAAFQGEKGLPAAPRVKLGIQDFIEKKAVKIALVGFVIVLGYSGVLTFLSKFAESTQNSDIIAISGIFHLVYSAVELVSRLITGKLLDQYGDNPVLYPSIIIFAAGLLLLGLSASGFMVICAALLIGLGYGTFFSCANAIAVKLAPPERAHLGTTTYFIFTNSSAGAGPFLLGVIVLFTSFRELYFILAAVVLLCIVLYYFAHGRYAKKAVQRLRS